MCTNCITARFEPTVAREWIAIVESERRALRNARLDPNSLVAKIDEREPCRAKLRSAKLDPGAKQSMMLTVGAKATPQVECVVDTAGAEPSLLMVCAADDDPSERKSNRLVRAPR